MSFSFLRTPTFKNTGSVARDHLASERTFLAWVRTGLSFVALGVAAERFSQLELANPEAQAALSNKERRQREEKEQTLIGALLGTGAGSVTYGIVRYYSTLRHLERGVYKPAYLGAAALSTVVAAMAGAAYWSATDDQKKRLAAKSGKK